MHLTMRNCEVEVCITLGWSETKGGSRISIRWKHLLSTMTVLKACEDPRKSPPISLFFQVMCVQIKCFHEIITIGYNVYHSYDLPWFRTLSW